MHEKYQNKTNLWWFARVLDSRTISEDDSKGQLFALNCPTSETLSIDDLWHSSTSVLFLSLVRGSGANQGAAIFWQLIKMSGLSGGVYTELYRAAHRALSAIRNNSVSAFQEEVYTDRIGPIVGTLESVRIIEVSTFQGCPQGGVPL